MKIKINIEKKHLYYLTILICLGLIGVVIAQGVYDNPAYHASLLVDYMKSKTSENAVIVEDDLIITGDTTTLNLEYTESFKGKKTYRLYKQESHNDCDNTLITTMVRWDICFLSQYYIHDVEMGGDNSAAECIVWIENTKDNFEDKPFDSGNKPTWKLQSKTDNYCSDYFDEGDVFCEAICMNFG